MVGKEETPGVAGQDDNASLWFTVDYYYDSDADESDWNVRIGVGMLIDD